MEPFAIHMGQLWERTLVDGRRRRFATPGSELRRTRRPRPQDAPACRSAADAETV